MKFNIRLLYLYLFSFVGLLIAVIGTGQLINLGLKVWVFKGADKYDYYPAMVEKGVFQEDQKTIEARQERETTRQRQRELSSAISMILVGVPLYAYHWRIIQKDKA